LHPSGVAKSSTSFGLGKGWNVTSAGWQVTLCNPIWHVSPSSGEACCELLYPVTLLYFTAVMQHVTRVRRRQLIVVDIYGCVHFTARRSVSRRTVPSIYTRSREFDPCLRQVAPAAVTRRCRAPLEPTTMTMMMMMMMMKWV